MIANIENLIYLNIKNFINQNCKYCTNGINLFVQVYGNKEWTFVDPKFTKWMYPVTRKDMFYAASYLDWRKDVKGQEEDGYPLYKYVPKFKTLLQPGDVLFSPQWWWHALPSAATWPPSGGGFSFGDPSQELLTRRDRNPADPRMRG